MRNKAILLVFAFLLFGIGIANAVTTVGPALTNGQLSGTAQLINASVAAADSVVNVTWYFRQNATTSTWTPIGSVLNASVDTNFSILWDTTTILDGSVELNATSWNDTAGTVLGDDDTVTVDIDNSIPLTTFGTDTPAADTERDNNTITLTTATDFSLTSCLLTVSPPISGTSTYNNTVTNGGRCVREIADVPDYTYSFTWTSADGLNTTAAGTARRVTIQTSEGGKRNEAVQVTTTADAKKGNTGLFVLIIAAIGLYMYSNKK